MIWYGLFFFGAISLLTFLVIVILFNLRIAQSLTFRFFSSFGSFISMGSLLGIFLGAFSYIHGISLGTESLLLENFRIWGGGLGNTTLNYTYLYYFPYIYIFILITCLSIICCLAYNSNESYAFINYCVVIVFAGLGVFFTDSLLWFFIAYEMLLLPSFFILYRFAKTRRCIEAAYLMFFWTQFGALLLLLGFLFMLLLTNSSSFSQWQELSLSWFEHSFLLGTLIGGFGVKLPIWPFYGWLPKAHVEASTNFSIFLSGVLVKIAFFGLVRCLIELQMETSLISIFPLLIVGLGDAVFKMFYQVDLKKLVAYSTVVEMHWLTICVLSGYTPLLLASFCMLISHALISSNSFFLVDSINRRFKTRLVTEISGLNFLCPRLFFLTLINLLLFLGFPGSIFFIAEILFFTFLLDEMPLVTIWLLPLLYLLGPIFFFRSWVNVMFGSSFMLNKKIPVDATSVEIIICGGMEVALIWLGLSWQYFLI